MCRKSISEIKNNSKKLIFYYGSPQSQFKIKDKNGVESIGKVTSITSIYETVKRDKISFQEAVIYLHYKKNIQ